MESDDHDSSLNGSLQEKDSGLSENIEKILLTVTLNVFTTSTIIATATNTATTVSISYECLPQNGLPPAC